MRLTGKRALITGSSQGIGAEIGRLFAREGAAVALNHRPASSHPEPVLQAVRKAGGRAIAVHCDVSDPESVRRMVSEVGEKLGGLDILINTAGLSDPAIWKVGLRKTTLDMWKKVFSVDVYGTFNCVKEASRLMKRGSIVNVASTPALAGDADGLVYASAKGAVVSMTRMLAKSMAPKIRVNCMAFGSLETAWVDWLGAEERESYRSAIPLRRFGRPEEAASLALYLASDESSFMTGQVLVLDGGEVMR
jgi:3-oxoacyl-[acyl-carrier protein] reductase